MLDIHFIRQNPERVQENTKNRKVNIDISHVLEIDTKYRELQHALQKLREERNSLTESLKKGKPTPEQITLGRKLKEKIEKDEYALSAVKQELDNMLLRIPNMSSSDMPVGKGEEDNREMKIWLPEKRYLPKENLGRGYDAKKYMPVLENAKHHLEIGESLDIIDTKQSAVISGSRFTYLKKEAVLLQYALFDLLSKKLLNENFIPMVPPLLVKERILVGTSHFPEGRDQVYKIESENIEENNDLFLVGSSEPPLFAYYMDKVIPERELPIKMFALTSCFRSEVGSWGKDVRGIKRVHQFDKLEMDCITTPEQAEEIMEELLSINEWLLQELKLPYRVINKCTGDCGYNATNKQYDVEVWLPGQQEFIETMTDTNATEYQARRMNIKYITKENEKKYVNTVNDTGCAMGRMIVAILDNYQQEDGSVIIPQVLQKYIGKEKITPKK